MLKELFHRHWPRTYRPPFLIVHDHAAAEDHRAEGVPGIGTSDDPYEHLVLQGAPKVVRNATQAIDGPAPRNVAHVQPLGTTTVADQKMRWYYVSPKTNDGSAYTQHLVLVWTASGHTYADGFHVVTTIADTRAPDRELSSTSWISSLTTSRTERWYVRSPAPPAGLLSPRLGCRCFLRDAPHLAPGR